MVVSVAFTAPIPSTMTKDQVWNGLVLKARDPRGFLKVVEDCVVVSERPDGITRRATFKGGNIAHEVIKYFPPYHMEFEMQETGSKVYNTISETADGQLSLTFTFLLRYPGVAEGSKEEKEKAAPMLGEVGRSAVSGTVEHLVELVKQGKV